MAEVVEYASYIIDLSMAMLEHQAALNDKQVHALSIIQQRAVDFLTEYMRHESSALPELLLYLGNLAQNPLKVIINCCEMLLTGQQGLIVDAYAEAFSEISDCADGILAEIQDMHSHLQDLMSNLGMVE